MVKLGVRPLSFANLGSSYAVGFCFLTGLHHLGSRAKSCNPEDGAGASLCFLVSEFQGQVFDFGVSVTG